MKQSLIFLLLTHQTFAATTATLYLTGVVPAKLSVSLAAEAIATTLPLDTTQNNTKIATLQEKSNSSTGYKILITSMNQGNLVSGQNSIPYTLNYDGQTVNLVAGSEFTYSAAAAVTNNRDIKISYIGDADENRVAGEYTDSVTFTIQAN
jgi:hypothetical protein